MKKCTLFTALVLTTCCMGLYAAGDDSNNTDNRNWRNRINDGLNSGVEKSAEESVKAVAKTIVEETVKRLYNKIVNKIFCSKSGNSLEALKKEAEVITALKAAGVKERILAKKRAELIRKYLQNNKKK